MSRLNIQNRTLAIMDNLRFLRSINNECIDLIAIDPPFAANETFTGQPRPPITDAEMEEERALAESHGAEYNEGVGETRVHDVWSWAEQGGERDGAGQTRRTSREPPRSSRGARNTGKPDSSSPGRTSPSFLTVEA